MFQELMTMFVILFPMRYFEKRQKKVEYFQTLFGWIDDFTNPLSNPFLEIKIFYSFCAKKIQNNYSSQEFLKKKINN